MGHHQAKYSGAKVSLNYHGGILVTRITARNRALSLANLLFIPIIVITVTTPVVAGYAHQVTASTFEVATIRRSDPKKPRPPALKNSPGRFGATNMTLRELLAMAYGLAFDTNQQISGGPAWINSERFDVVATEDEAIVAQLSKLPREQQGSRYRAMIQELLSDRFKLSLHHETRELITYTLLLAKGGPKLQAGVLDPKLPANIPQSRINIMGAGFLEGHNAPTGDLAKVLNQQPEIGGRTVIDNTKLSGKYDFTLKWTPDSAIEAHAPRAESQEVAPELFTALREQLGLRLASAKASVEVIVVDNADLPSEN
jgi:uncharacterized protein (TIGR03435 family)